MKTTQAWWSSRPLYFQSPNPSLQAGQNNIKFSSISKPWQGRWGHTEELVTTASTSPLCALMSTVNLSITPPKIPSLLFSAKVSKRFLTVLSPGICLVIRSMIVDLLAGLKVGEEIILTSVTSLSRVCLRIWRDLSVESRAEVFADAVY